MNTRDDDRRALAVEQAATGSGAWRSAVHAQLAAFPDHVDFYALTGEMVETLRSLSGLAGVLVGQVATYGRGRVLRDDVPGHDPAERLAIASSWAAHLQHDLAHADRTANQLWNELSHIAVEDPS